MKFLFFLACFIIKGLGFLDYTDDHLLVCTSIDQDLSYLESYQYLWNISILHVIDRIVYLTIPPILIMIQILFIVVFVKYRQTLFKRQGTIFFAIIVIQTVLNFYYFTHALYVTLMPYGGNMPSSFPAFCITFGIINQAAENSLDLYLLYFVIYTFLNMKTSIKSTQVIRNRFIHSSVLVVSLAWIIFLYLDQRISVDQFGLCGCSNLRYNTIQWFFPIQTISTNFMYVMFALYTYRYFKKHMPVNDSLTRRIYNENQSISYFVIVYSILITLFDVSLGAVYFNCFRQNPINQLLIFATIMNLSRILQSMFLLYFIMVDQAMKKKTKKFLRSFFQKKRDQSTSFTDELQTKDVDFSNPDYQNLDITLKQKILEFKEDEYQIDIYRIAQITTMIAGICIAQIEYFNTKTFTSVIRKLHYKQKVQFSIQPNTLKDYKIEVSQLPKAGILRGTITMIAPRIFSKLLHSDGLESVQKSFNLFKNYHKMYNIAEGKGGKSGQFFFFSYDYKYVLKTITKDQYLFIVQNLEQFFQYYEKNPNTLLAKIYGLYTIKGEDIGKEYDLILMKNMFGCKKKQVIRTYDLKGSKHHRQVIKQKLIYNQLQSLTLKDTDFIKLQSKIHISKENIISLRAILRKDTLFLKNFNLIDYSLLVIRVKWDQKPQYQQFWNESQRVKSQKHQNQYYHIGLIDYMQAWNISKKSQNCLKSLLGKKQISAQQPNFYQKRFMQFFQEITYFQNQGFPIGEMIQKHENNKRQAQEQQDGYSKALKDWKLKVLQLSASKKQAKLSTTSKNQKQPFLVPKQISQINSKSSMHSESGPSSLEVHLFKKDAIITFKQISLDSKQNGSPLVTPIFQLAQIPHFSQIQKQTFNVQ